MTRRTLDRCTTYREVDAAITNHPDVVRIERNGATVKVYGPRGMVVYHNHPSQAVKRGTLRSILRMAALAGLAVLVLILALGLL